jgi:hypothetical protein
VEEVRREGRMEEGGVEERKRKGTEGNEGTREQAE